MIDMINGKIKVPIPNVGDLDAMKLRYKPKIRLLNFFINVFF